jgi:hypothetical protein
MATFSSAYFVKQMFAWSQSAFSTAFTQTQLELVNAVFNEKRFNDTISASYLPPYNT